MFAGKVDANAVVREYLPHALATLLTSAVIYFLLVPALFGSSSASRKGASVFASSSGGDDAEPSLGISGKKGGAGAKQGGKKRD